MWQTQSMAQYWQSIIRVHAGSWWWLSMTGNVQATLGCILCGICWLSFLYVFLILFWCDRPNLWRSIGSPSSESTWDPDDGRQWLGMFRQHLAALYAGYVRSLFRCFFLVSFGVTDTIYGAVLAVHHPGPHGILMMAVNDWGCLSNIWLHYWAQLRNCLLQCSLKDVFDICCQSTSRFVDTFCSLLDRQLKPIFNLLLLVNVIPLLLEFESQLIVIFAITFSGTRLITTSCIAHAVT